MFQCIQSCGTGRRRSIDPRTCCFAAVATCSYLCRVALFASWLSVQAHLPTRKMCRIVRPFGNSQTVDEVGLRALQPALTKLP